MVSNLQNEINKFKSSEDLNLKNVIHSSNQKDLDLLKERIEKIEKENNNLMGINHEELRKNKEQYTYFVKSTQKFWENIRNLFLTLQKTIPLEDYLIQTNSFNVSNEKYDLNKIFEKLENEFSNFGYLINQALTSKSIDENSLIIFNTNKENSPTQIPFFINNHEYSKNNTCNNLQKEITTDKNAFFDNKKNNNTNINEKGNFEITNHTFISLKEKNKELIEIINKLEIKNKLLEDQFEILKFNYNTELKLKNEKETKKDKTRSLNRSLNNSNENNWNNNYKENDNLLENLKSEMEEQKAKYKEIEITLEYIRKLNKDLESKNAILEEELINSKKNIKIANERLIENEKIKEKNEVLEKELTYKQSIISYLENIMKINKSNYKIFCIK